MSDRDRILKIIQALRAKTVKNGATEPEAWAAAEKLTALLLEHNLSLSDVDIEQDRYGATTAAYGNRQMHEVAKKLGGHIARLFDCHGIIDQGRLTYFGSQVDVSAAHYLTDLLCNCADAEWGSQQRRVRKGDADGGTDRAARASFLSGFIDRVSARIWALKTSRERTVHAETTSSAKSEKWPGQSNALVVQKKEIVKSRYDQWIEAQKIKLGKVRRQARKETASADAYAAGAAAGDTVNITTGVEAAATRKIGGRA